MQPDIIKQIIHLPIAERIEIIEKVSRSVREDMSKNGIDEENSIKERKRAYSILRGIATIECKTPPTDEEIKEDYINYISEKYK